MTDALRPLQGMRILITRPKEQSEPLAEEVARLGGIPIEFPTIRIDPTSGDEEIERSAQNAGSYDWIVFTSANGAKLLLGTNAKKALEPRGQNPRIAAVGPSTAKAVEEFGLKCSFIPSDYLTASLAYELPDVNGQRVLLVRAEETDSHMASVLKKRGAKVDEIHPYRVTIAPPATPPDAYDAILFTSPSTVLGFRETIPESQAPRNRNPIVCCIGPVTARAAETQGFKVDVVAKEHTTQGIVNALVERVTSA